MPESKLGWGKLSEGQPYLPFAFDVGRAIFALGLGENVGSLLWYVLEISWGSTPKVQGEWLDPVPCPLDCIELAERWGVHRNRLYEAKRWLIEARILKEVAGGFVVNKKVESWTNPKGGACPLLSPERLAWAEEAKTRSRKRSPELSSHVGPLFPSPVCGGSPLLEANPCHVEPLLEVNGCHVEPPQKPRCNVAAHIERAPGFEKEKKAKAAASVDSAAADFQNFPTEVEARKPAYPDDRLIVKPGAFDPSLEESRAFFDQLWDAYHLPGLCREWWVNRRQYDLRAWKAALAKLTDRGTAIRTIGYLAMVAADWKAGSTPAASRSNPRFRETGPPPPPVFEPLTPQRIAEIQGGYKRDLERGRERKKPSKNHQVPARWLGLVGADGHSRGLHTPETLTGS